MKVIGLYTIHDSNIAVSVDGEIKVVLELERLMGKRYYHSPTVGRAQLKLFKILIKADKWVAVDHHVCHAATGFYDSPFNSAIVASSDGAGNITSFQMFSATRENGLRSLWKIPGRIGSTYGHIACMLPEVTGDNYFGQDEDPEYLPEGIDVDHSVEADLGRFMGLPGKKMGYAALGKPREEWFSCMSEVYEAALPPKAVFYTIHDRLGLDDFPVPDKSIARDLAATSQYWFSVVQCKEIGKALEEHMGDPSNPPIDGIVITGGCGLNVGMNQVVVEKFGLPVHVPCAAGDPGIGVGACWCIEPPKKFTQLMYIGLPLFDHDLVDSIATERGARKVTVSEVADLLMKQHIIGVVRGRTEFGPRALGHRSLLAYPDKVEQLGRINQLKKRQFYRPACPSVTEESAMKIFKGRKDSDRMVCHEKYLDLYNRDDRFNKKDAHPNEASSQFPDENDPSNFLPRSPYMSFAPTMKEECRKMFPAVCHFDNTARLQTVSQNSEPWFYALLQEIGKRNGGYEILINTSFNIKGEPILNKLSTALEIMDTEAEGLLPYVVCEDWLFTPKE